MFKCKKAIIIRRAAYKARKKIEFIAENTVWRFCKSYCS